jgi:signal transduction histidine kinase
MLDTMRPRPGDLLAAAAAALVAIYPWLWPHGPAQGRLPGWCAWPAAAVLALPLLQRRRAPLQVVCLTGIGAVCTAAAGVPAGRMVPGLMIAAYAVTMYGHGRRRQAAGVAVAAAAALVALALNRHVPVFVVSALAVVLAVTMAGLSGYAIRTRRAYIAELTERAARLEREEGERARRAVAGERLRIARELHDVIGHAVSVIAIQAEAASRSLTADPAAVPGFLTAISATSRRSLAEMRRLLDILRPEETEQDELTPLPGLAELPDLIARVEAAGVQVTLEQAGDLAGLPAGVGLAAFRIVQEALTNVLKHAGPAMARVSLSRDPAVLRLHISDNGSKPAKAPAPGAHGLIGMRERVHVYGGTLHAGPCPEGGYAITAILPVPGKAGP